jgi:thioredoxin 1
MKFFKSTIILLLLLSSFHAAAEIITYKPELFDQLIKEKKPVLIAIHASWCSTCRSQRFIIEDLITKPEFKNLNVLRVDYDEQKKAVRYFKATTQSTLIVYKGGFEVGRSIADTSYENVEKMLDKSL